MNNDSATKGNSMSPLATICAPKSTESEREAAWRQLYIHGLTVDILSQVLSVPTTAQIHTEALAWFERSVHDFSQPDEALCSVLSCCAVPEVGEQLFDRYSYYLRDFQFVDIVSNSPSKEIASAVFHWVVLYPYVIAQIASECIHPTIVEKAWQGLRDYELSEVQLVRIVVGCCVKSVKEEALRRLLAISSFYTRLQN